MKIDASGYCSSIDTAGEAAVRAERIGHDGWWATETQIDPFLACAVAAERTERIGIGTAWATGEPLSFRGEFYRHTPMTPFVDPGPNPYGNPMILLAGVGPLMTEAAGEVADGLLCHPFSTERYLREVTLPAVQRGRAKAGKTTAGFEITGPSMIVTGDTEAELVAGARWPDHAHHPRHTGGPGRRAVGRVDRVAAGAEGARSGGVMSRGSRPRSRSPGRIRRRAGADSRAGC